MLRLAQNALAQDTAMRLHEGEGGIVADRADIAEVVGDAFKLGHQGAQIDSARRHGDLERGFDGAREGERMGDRTVAGDAGGEPRRLVDRLADHQPLDALVNVAEPRLKAGDRFAISVKAEMSGFDDPGMYGSDGDLVQLGIVPA